MRTQSILAALFMVIATAIIAISLIINGSLPDATSNGESNTSEIQFLPVTEVSSTLVGFHHVGPPPWPNGNCFTLKNNQNGPSTHVINMHSENFGQAVKLFQLDKIQVKMLSPTQCMIIDPRIPKSWLMTKPCPHCTSPELANRMQEELAKQANQP